MRGSDGYLSFPGDVRGIIINIFIFLRWRGRGLTCLNTPPPFFRTARGENRGIFFQYFTQFHQIDQLIIFKIIGILVLPFKAVKILNYKPDTLDGY